MRVIQLVLAAVSLAVCFAQERPVKSGSTNVAGFYLLERDGQSPIAKLEELQKLPLKSEPILSDKDFVSWDVKKHSFVLKAEAAKRLVPLADRITPFVLVCNGERVYAGQFGTSFSSASAAIPTILLDTLKFNLFVNAEKIPPAFWRELMLRPAETLEKSNYKIQDVKLQIDAGYPPPDGFGGKDLRGDKRVTAAVEKLENRD